MLLRFTDLYKIQGSFQNSIHTKLHTNVLCSFTNATQFSFNVNAKCHNSLHFFSWANSYSFELWKFCLTSRQSILAFLIGPLGSTYSLFLADFLSKSGPLLMKRFNYKIQPYSTTIWRVIFSKLKPLGNTRSSIWHLLIYISSERNLTVFSNLVPPHE